MTNGHQITITEWLGLPDYYNDCGELQQGWMREGFRNSYHEEPDHDCVCEVIDTQGQRFRSEFRKDNGLGSSSWDCAHSKGYDFAWWREIKHGDCATCRFQFWKHKGGKGVRSCQYHGGKDGCHYEARRSCETCHYYREVVDAYTCEKLGQRTCSKYEAWSNNMNMQPEEGCEYWKGGTPQ